MYDGSRFLFEGITAHTHYVNVNSGIYENVLTTYATVTTA